jgi:hypothetical protein
MEYKINIIWKRKKIDSTDQDKADQMISMQLQ